MKKHIHKSRNILIAIGIISLIFCSGLNSVTACYLNTPLLASREEIEIGKVEVKHYSKYDDKLYIIYTITEPGWLITETHVAVATSFEDIPQNKKGNPKVGHFPYADTHPGGVTMVKYIIDLDDYGLRDGNGEYHGTLFFATHAVVYNPGIGEETAWADTGYYFPGANWAIYFFLTF